MRLRICRTRSPRLKPAASTCSYLRIRPTNEKPLSCSSPEDTSRKSTRLPRNRARKRLPTMVDEKKAALGTGTKRYMRTVAILMFMSFASPLLSRGQSVPTAESPAPARIYHLLREDDDWSFLADPAKRQEF